MNQKPSARSFFVETRPVISESSWTAGSMSAFVEKLVRIPARRMLRGHHQLRARSCDATADIFRR